MAKGLAVLVILMGFSIFFPSQYKYSYRKEKTQGQFLVCYLVVVVSFLKN
jgi:hypothetical protein